MEFQKKSFQWNQSHEAGLLSDKEILKNPDDNRAWIVQAAMCRVLSELITLAETASVTIPAIPKPKK